MFYQLQSLVFVTLVSAMLMTTTIAMPIEGDGAEGSRTEIAARQRYLVVEEFVLTIRTWKFVVTGSGMHINILTESSEDKAIAMLVIHYWLPSQNFMFSETQYTTGNGQRAAT
ncbi:hypothetical protein BJ912DRAFT_924720 [Pholiota molesta]|nr:hypothetical protein BJ912DRAFT_924720 [Pholiota molesta]